MLVVAKQQWKADTTGASEDWVKSRHNKFTNAAAMRYARSFRHCRQEANQISCQYEKGLLRCCGAEFHSCYSLLYADKTPTCPLIGNCSDDRNMSPEDLFFAIYVHI